MFYIVIKKSISNVYYFFLVYYSLEYGVSIKRLKIFKQIEKYKLIN